MDLITCSCQALQEHCRCVICNPDLKNFWHRGSVFLLMPWQKTEPELWALPVQPMCNLCGTSIKLLTVSETGFGLLSKDSFHVSDSHCSVSTASLFVCFLPWTVVDVSADVCVDFIAEAQPNPAVLASFHTGTHQRQTDRAGRDLWRGQSEVQRALCWLLLVSRPAVASGILHWPSRGAAGNLYSQYWFTKQVETFLHCI